MATRRSSPEPCPYCGKTLDADSGATPGGAGPRPGDVGICWGCLAPLVFDGAMHRRKPTPAEAVEIAAHPVIQSVIRRARADR
jgi:hypothetical protein